MTPFDVVAAGPESATPPAFDCHDRRTVSSEVQHRFAEDGVACLQGVLGERDVSLLRSAVDDAMAHPSEHGYSVANSGDPGFFFTDYNLWGATTMRLVSKTALIRIRSSQESPFMPGRQRRDGRAV